MKAKHSLFLALLLIVFACKDQFIDDVKKVPQNEDATAPSVTVNYPLDGASVRALTDEMPLNIRVTASDDIEVAEIVVLLDGNNIGTFDSFIDYRNAAVDFIYPNLTNGTHTLTVEATDLTNKTTTKTVNFEKAPPYDPIYDEVFYMPFDGDYLELITLEPASRIGLPSFSDVHVVGKSYQGANEAYLTYPIDGLNLGSSFTAAFWYKINPTPDRSGILAISAPNPDVPGDNNLKTGFRLFREGSATNQSITANVGFGTDGAWITGASINPQTTTGWVHIAMVIEPTKVSIYLNGTKASENTFPGIVWPSNTTPLSIASGMPNFKAWNHLSDGSLYDELRIFDRALTEAEIDEIIAADQD